MEDNKERNTKTEERGREKGVKVEGVMRSVGINNNNLISFR